MVSLESGVGWGCARDRELRVARVASLYSAVSTPTACFSSRFILASSRSSSTHPLPSPRRYGLLDRNAPRQTRVRHPQAADQHDGHVGHVWPLHPQRVVVLLAVRAGGVHLPRRRVCAAGAVHHHHPRPVLPAVPVLRPARPARPVPGAAVVPGQADLCKHHPAGTAVLLGHGERVGRPRQGGGDDAAIGGAVEQHAARDGFRQWRPCRKFACCGARVVVLA